MTIVGHFQCPLTKGQKTPYFAHLSTVSCEPYGSSTIRLTSYTNYALRMLMYCALHPGKTVRVEDVSTAYGISRAHLLKAARQLGQLGYLENLRGRSGGIRLGMPAEDIGVGKVVRHTEGDLELVECFNEETNTCPLIGSCKMSTLFRAGLEAFLAELDKVTVADLVENRGVLLDRLDAFAKTDQVIGSVRAKLPAE